MDSKGRKSLDTLEREELFIGRRHQESITRRLRDRGNKNKTGGDRTMTNGDRITLTVERKRDLLK